MSSEELNKSLGTAAQPISTATPRTERKAAHVLDNYYIGPARDRAVLEIWAYTDKIGYRPGETVDVHLSTTGDTWSMHVARDGLVFEPVLTLANQPGQYHDTPLDCYATGCGWPVAHSFEIPDNWKPGGYLMTFTARRGEEVVEEHHIIIVRAGPDRKPARMVLVCATGTWVSYNDWGGSNAYDGIAGENGDEYSPILSLQRPWTRGFAKLPAGAPRTLPDHPPRPGEMVRYPYMEWAYAYGYSKKYASAGWASYERHFAIWAEANGYDVDFIALHDLDQNPELLSPYRCAVFVGHDEYWSGPMRDAVDKWVERGGRAARFAGNFLWQTRMQDEGQTQICYKYFANERDPVMGTGQQHLLTNAWEVPAINRPGASTFGVNALEGVYAGLGNCIGRGAAGFTIYRPEHWAFDGAYLGYGDVLGAESRIFGYEVDGLDYTVRDGLVFSTAKSGAPDGLQVLGMGLATNAEADHRVWGETLYIGDGGAIWKADALHGDTSDETVAKVSRGNGMIVHFEKGKGEVFTAATCEWVTGLARHDAQVEQITRNVLNRFIGQHG